VALNPKLCVLVVDDQPMMLGAVGRILRRFEVTRCSTVGEARRALEVGSFDAIVSDVEIEGSSGIEWFWEVEATRPEVAARFVFMSGVAGHPDIQALLEETGQPYMRKPFTVALFAELVAAVAESRKPRSMKSGGYRVGKKVPRA
jgi:DNA-binding NtrC family response regulator